MLDLDGARDMVRELSARHNLSVDPDAEVEDLPVGTQQRVEILKALSRKVDLLILDEPTAVLTPQETDELLGVMKELAAGGTSIVFITHKLREVLAVADRCYVLRQGKVVGGVDDLTNTTTSDLASMMVGRDVVLRIDKAEATPGDTVLSIKGLAGQGRPRAAAPSTASTSRCAPVRSSASPVSRATASASSSSAIAGMRPSVAGSVHLGSAD